MNAVLALKKNCMISSTQTTHVYKYEWEKKMSSGLWTGGFRSPDLNPYERDTASNTILNS